jgi:hypothetical protein
MREQQDIHREIFYLACHELPNRIHTFKGEEVIFYKGFRISRLDHVYQWQDIRYNDYYEPVNKFVTDNILKSKDGFCRTLVKVMAHNDLEKLDNLKRDIEKLNAQTAYWVKKSSENWSRRVSQRKGITNNETLSDEEIKDKLIKLNNKYNNNRLLYEKKRNILKEEKEDIQADIVFYNSRIRNHRNT